MSCGKRLGFVGACKPFSVLKHLVETEPRAVVTPRGEEQPGTLA